ncbi:MAG TPA: ABC transporter permease [Baekduia sp.]|uniref:ABC transporter permease n=1 Tax=Baekduia sp. TaxID=2600305 RepID=UPI002D776CEB|nr:ABC transporter permease [Baekduia sp.]HET6509130.1 ABC transporter permease [Baekduia sp.]
MTHQLESYALVGLWAAVAVAFSVWSKTSTAFFTMDNVRAILISQSVTAIVALGALVPLVTNEWDLSVGVASGLAAVVSASLMSNGVPLVLAAAASIVLCLAIGGLNGGIVTRLRVNAVITTLGVATILDGVINQKTGGSAVVADLPEGLISFGSSTWIGIPKPAYVMAAAAGGVYYLLRHTPFGRYLYALGSNPSAGVLVGLRTKLLLTGAFACAGLLAGGAGVLEVAVAGGADPRVGDSFTLPALAAAFLSAASITPGRYNVGGTLVAIFFLATLNSGLNFAGAPPYVGNYVNGVALIAGVGLGAFLGRKRTLGVT